MDGQSYGIQWIQHAPNDMKTAGQLLIDAQPPQDEEIMANGAGSGGSTEYLVDGDGDVPTEADIDQIAAENLIFMARDGQMMTEIIAAGTDEHGAIVVSASDAADIDCEAMMQQASVGMRSHHQVDDAGGGESYTEHYTDTTPQMVTEEIITDDWVQHQGEERVEIPAEQIMGSSSQVLLDIEVPLPTVQDEYTALRPYPCDFCSRRFRKKASLMNHMVAHQNDRPHLCKLCGSRFFRRSDLINHLKAHAEAPNPEFDDTDFINFVEQEQTQSRQVNDHYYDQDWGMQADSIVIPSSLKSSRTKTQLASGNSSSTSTSTVIGRGRISRLKPKEESYSGISDYMECQELQADTAAVKLTQDQDHLPQPQPVQQYPIIDDSKPFVCQQCGLAFAREKALLSHSKNHRNDSPYECNQCNEIFWDISSLQEHQKSHQFEESNSEYDPADAEETQSDDESESENLYGEFYCSKCGMSFHRQDLLRRHAKTHTKTEAGAEEQDNIRDRHCCNTCGETFAEALDLLAHAEIHARYPDFKCVLCGESFFEEHTIKRHIQSMHAGEMTPNSCILCGKECRDRKALIKHAWDHSREKCHSCSKCGKNFHNKARLKRHMSSHRDKSVSCDVCHEEFPDGRSLSNHRHSHSATSAGKLFPCHECGKTFGSRSSQQIHVRIHTGERPYGCRYCWKAFADGGTLRKHERIHTGEKPYACSVCPRAFNQRVVLREHIRSHHSGLDEKRGTYFCTVCSAELPSSGDLIQHLIQHSDMNTAMQRQPITGPRKYKRRRKLKPHEIARLRSENKQNGNGSDIDMSDFDMENVEEFLGVADSPASKAGANSNRSGKEAAAQRNNESGNTVTSEEGNAAAEDGEYIDNDEEEGESTLEVVSTNNGQQRYNNITKLINSNSSEENYKSLLSNLENTLQSIDPLVVDHRASAAGGEKGNVKIKHEQESTAQRTQQFKIVKVEGKSAAEAAHAANANVSKNSRKKLEKQTKINRPRMIHTERATTEGSSKRRAKTYIARTESAFEQLLPKSRSTMVDDYEIISPDTQPPKQISSSPLHIKQEHEQHKHRRLHHLSTSSSLGSHTSRGDLYDAQLLLEASALRKETLEKFNPNLVNALEDILRSPVKCDQNERQRFTSESSTTFLVEQSEEEEQHLIKIEPTSPDLREIVSGASVSATGISSSSSGAANTSMSSASGSSAERRSTRCTRSSRLVTANRKYLEFETDHTPLPKANTAGSPQKRAVISATKSRAIGSKQTKQPAISVTSVKSQSYFPYTIDAYCATPSSAARVVASSYSYSNAAVDATAAEVAAVVSIAPPERKQRYFECEMCSAVFPDRAQLLDHVPIHI